MNRLRSAQQTYIVSHSVENDGLRLELISSSSFGEDNFAPLVKLYGSRPLLLLDHANRVSLPETLVREVCGSMHRKQLMKGSQKSFLSNWNRSFVLRDGSNIEPIGSLSIGLTPLNKDVGVLDT